MKTDGVGKVIIKVGPQEQQASARNSRKTLKHLQESADDKENLAGRPRAIKTVKLEGDNDNEDHKHKKLMSKATQTGESTVTVEDLTSSDEPSSDYWRLLAEQKTQALNDSLQENDRLKEQIEVLETENKVCKEMLDEAKHLVAVLEEMVASDEADSSVEIVEEARERA